MAVMSVTHVTGLGVCDMCDIVTLLRASHFTLRLYSPIRAGRRKPAIRRLRLPLSATLQEHSGDLAELKQMVGGHHRTAGLCLA